MATVKTMGVLGTILMVFIAVIVGISLLRATADNVDEIVNTNTITNESFTGNIGQYVSLGFDDWASVQGVRNHTGATLAANTDYVVNLTGGSINITVAGNNSDASTTYYADYTFYPDNYVKNAPARTITNLVLIFGALAIIGVGFLAFKNQIMDMFGK